MSRGERQPAASDLLDLIKTKRQHMARLANQGGASGEGSAIEIGTWLPRPRGRDLKTLLQALANEGLEIKASSFDAIACSSSVDFSNALEVQDALSRMTFIEIKSSRQVRTKLNFNGFFFALTESEIAAAECLGERHRVALYNALSGELLMTSIPEILARAKSSTWQLSVQL